MASIFENLRITTDFSIRLCALLRQRGVDVGTQQSMACMQAILLFETVDEEELKRIFRVTLINRKQDLWQLLRAYDLLLQEYLSPSIDPEVAPPQEGRQPTVVKRRYYADDAAAILGDDTTFKEGYSVREVDQHKDFRLMPRQDLPTAMAVLKKIARRHASIARRKTRRSRRHGRIDLRASVRDSVKFDGEILNWRFKRKLPTHARFVILADVSGSMEIYSIFLLNFLHLLNVNRYMKLESFVFSTRLERLTPQMRSRNFPEMLKNVARQFTAWSGGTKIGAAIEALNENYGALVTPKTHVIIMSDGWDTGDIALLDREMAKLDVRARSITWINPLKAAPAYEPLALGMATARPYCDRFITGHSLNSLDQFAALLSN
jgi:uncharacterized protein with von Willebrand factor type A (vWA) domain